MIFGDQSDYDAMIGKPSEGHPAWSQQDLQAMFQFMESINNDLAESGELVDGQGLAEPSQSVVIQRVLTALPWCPTGRMGRRGRCWPATGTGLRVERVTEIAKALSARCLRYAPPMLSSGH
jgi:hypothetical protein